MAYGDDGSMRVAYKADKRVVDFGDGRRFLSTSALLLAAEMLTPLFHNVAGRPGGLVGIHVKLLKFQVMGSSHDELSLFLTFVPGKIGSDFS